MKPMCHALDGDGIDTGIGEQNFRDTAGGGISLES
jgi:hypothetical protein